MGVEEVAAQRDGVIGKVAVTRPGSGDFALAVPESHTREAVPAERRRVDAEPTQLADRSRRERVAARLVPSDRSFLDDGDVVSGTSQPRRDRRSGRSTADDEDVGVQGARRQPADAGEPAMASGPIGVMSAIAGASGDVKSYVPASSSANTGDSSEHQVSYSSAHSSLVGSAPPRP